MEMFKGINATDWQNTQLVYFHNFGSFLGTLNNDPTDAYRCIEKLESFDQCRGIGMHPGGTDTVLLIKCTDLHKPDDHQPVRLHGTSKPVGSEICL